eukprot:TRINITY_DN112_c0_g1_i1.p1 TRINITY_DN112_c0_g1~~TRINITY_DN112_c0_g1_i1.p1  ORF type:complete len:233 (+),score=26.76 TRINITY_DN112_c0_g1_i1:172-870(+)
MSDRTQFTEKRVEVTTKENYKLEAVLAKSNERQSKVGAVICHPMPLLGGNFNNNVVVSMSRGLTCRLGFTTLRYNVRGVGKSEGKNSWRGGPERSDVLACSKYLLQEVGVSSVLLVGYSYGSVIASSVADEMNEIMGYVSISYPFGPLSFMLLGHLLSCAKTCKDKLFIMGDRDSFTGVETFRRRVDEMPDSKRYRIVKGGDHFWFGKENVLLDLVEEWVRELLEREERCYS